MLVRLILVYLTVWISIAQADNILTDVSVSGNTLKLKFGHRFDPASMHAFRLAKSGSVRYVFDIGKCRLGSHTISAKLRRITHRSARISQYRAHTVRVVIESAHPYHLVKKSISSHIYSLSMPTTKHRTTPKSSVARRASDTHQQSSDSVKGLFAGVGKWISQAGSQLKNPHRSGRGHKAIHLKHTYSVVIDPGHGGHDSGAVGAHKMEKTLVLQIAKRVRRHLLSMGFRVIMTRSSDRFVKLGRRTRYANKKHGDLFVSIHANSVSGVKNRYRHGVETYFLQTTRSARAKRVAARENSVVLRKSDRLSKNVILNAVMTGPKIVLSNKLAIDIQKHILGNLRTKYRGVKDGGVRPAPFWVLVGAEMPAVLVETGYISNTKERQRLFSSRYQDLLARGIAEGIANYLSNREKEIE